jgi:putative ATPase
MSLFDPTPPAAPDAPLAARMRPRTLDELAGQAAIVGPGTVLRRAIEADRLFSSILLWGPPGTGKTTLARIIAGTTRSRFESVSAVLAGVADLRRVIDAARKLHRADGRRTIVFVDEVHRWNKAQQDALLPHVEDGTIVFVGATTENPYFEVIPALVSRSRVFHLEPLSEDDLLGVLRAALSDPERGYGARRVEADDEALAHVARVAGGDARNALNALELAVEAAGPDADPVRLTLEVAEQAMQRRAIRYDKGGDEHYDTISAFIKSVRGSDPDAALYWLAKMLHAGESPRFVLRRLLILAGEDVGLADPHGLVVTAAAAQAFEWVGMPEGVYPIALATLYLATAPKSNSAKAYFGALEAVEEKGSVEVPDHLRDPARDARALGHGKGYVYPHDQPGHHVGQQYLPWALAGVRFYEPSHEGHEAAIAERLARWRDAQRRALEETERERPRSPRQDRG